MKVKVLGYIFVAAIGGGLIGCLPAEEKASESSSTIVVQAVNKAGVPYDSLYLGAGTGIGSQLHQTDAAGLVEFDLSPGLISIIPGINDSGRNLVYAKGTNYISEVLVASGQSNYTAVFPEVVYEDPLVQSASPLEQVLTTENQFAVAVDLASQTQFCMAGIGVGFGGNTVPAGTHISVHADNAGEPAGAHLLDSSDVDFISLVGVHLGGGTQVSPGGATANFCDAMSPTQSLAAGRYWIVIKFSAPPTTCAHNPCFTVYGNAGVGSAGLPVLSSADAGSTWNSRSFAGNEPFPRISLNAFLIE